MDGSDSPYLPLLAGARQEERQAQEDRVRQDDALHARLQRRLLEFEQLQWEGRRSLALEAAMEILAEFGFDLAADEGEPDWVDVGGWGQQARLPSECLRGFLRELVCPRAPRGADAVCRNCESPVMAGDPGCWNCSASFRQREWRPEVIGERRGGLGRWWRRIWR
ncbi:MAG: hypothetical protein IT368_05940 [Candidatus Hydrogenedentes bacterium]|nr:hypothetical protein [Phycisphaeraceae bacterium]MCC6143329.1 hypothetical protein [Candidatus Hydrogenedentota bacterium]